MFHMMDYWKKKDMLGEFKNKQELFLEIMKSNCEITLSMFNYLKEKRRFPMIHVCIEPGECCDCYLKMPCQRHYKIYMSRKNFSDYTTKVKEWLKNDSI